MLGQMFLFTDRSIRLGERFLAAMVACEYRWPPWDQLHKDLGLAVGA
jgi:hypothetical protein